MKTERAVELVAGKVRGNPAAERALRHLVEVLGDQVPPPAKERVEAVLAPWKARAEGTLAKLLSESGPLTVPERAKLGEVAEAWGELARFSGAKGSGLIDGGKVDRSAVPAFPGRRLPEDVARCQAWLRKIGTMPVADGRPESLLLVMEAVVWRDKGLRELDRVLGVRNGHCRIRLGLALNLW